MALDHRDLREAIRRAGDGVAVANDGLDDERFGHDLIRDEAYRTRLKTDAEGRENFAFAQAKRFIVSEERSFTEVVEGTLGVAP